MIPSTRHAGFRPSYLGLSRRELWERVERALAGLADCRVCPRDCRVNRLEDRWAACKTGRHAVVGSWFPHFGEEDCLRGWNGSGTIFFSHCNLRCVFCFHPDTPVATANGPVRIEDLFEAAARRGEDPRVREAEDGNRAVTRMGTSARVSKVFRHEHSGDLIRLKPFNAPPLLLTPDHRVFAVTASAPDTVIRVRADQLTRDHRLLVALRESANAEVVLDVRSILSAETRYFRRARASRVTTPELAALFAGGGTSEALASVTGYHPAYLRKLRGQWRRAALPGGRDSIIASNDVLDEEGRIRFKTELRPGVPARVLLDERLAWLLGLYCAEGHVTTQRKRPNSHRLVFSFGPHEPYLAERVGELLAEIFQVEAGVRHRRTTVTVEVGKASLALLFKELSGKRSREKRVPPPLFRAKASVVEAFLDGVVTGDGCERSGHLVVNTVSRTLAYGLFEIGLQLGVLPSFHRWSAPRQTTIEGRIVRQSPLYIVKFPKRDRSTGEPRSGWKRSRLGYLVPIHRIDRVPYEGPVYNLEVDDPDHSYVAAFVAVANCQNYDISQAVKPQAQSGSPPEEIARMMLALQAQGCHNINFVTPEHVAPQVLEAVAVAVEQGLGLPIVYNTSAYDSLESIELMRDVVDIYMPDFKYWSRERSREYLKAEDYPDAARAAIRTMHEQVGPLVVGPDGLARRGLIVRHLVMPGSLDETRAILEWIARELGPETYVNVMDQYYPAGKVGDGRYPELGRGLTPREFHDARAIARDLGLRRLDERGPHPLLRRRAAL